MKTGHISLSLQKLNSRHSACFAQNPGSRFPYYKLERHCLMSVLLATMYCVGDTLKLLLLENMLLHIVSLDSMQSSHVRRIGSYRSHFWYRVNDIGAQQSDKKYEKRVLWMFSIQQLYLCLGNVNEPPRRAQTPVSAA